MQAIFLHCSLDSPILIINLYRHPNSKTPFVFYSNLLAEASSHKYSLIIGDFNAHHQAWGDSRVDGQGDAIVRACDTHNMIILNDGLPTFISSSGQASSTIDLSISSRGFGLLTSVSTLQDLHGSDHFPVSISVACASPSSFRFSNRLNLPDKLLPFLHSRLAVESSKFYSTISSLAVLSNPLRMYDTFCSFLLDNISSFFPRGTLPSRRKRIPSGKSPSPWWNHTCDEAVEFRRTLLRLYKASPSLDNWLAFKRGNLRCRKILRREKRKDWKLLCSEFSFKTPTASIWRFIRAFKNKSFSSGNLLSDDNMKIEMQDQLLSKLCPPSCLHLNSSSSVNCAPQVSRSDSPLARIDDPFTALKLDLAVFSSKRKSSPGLDRFDYGIIRFLPSDLLAKLLNIYNDLYS